MTNEALGEGCSGTKGRAGWTREQASRIERTDDTVAPIVYPPQTEQIPEVHIWDTWFLRNRDGTLATVDGYRVCFSLTAPSDLLPGKRHDVATIRCFYSDDGRNWHNAGPVFEEPLGQRQWAGSALYDDDGSVYLFYTAAGEEGAEDLTYTQRIVGAGGGSIETADEFELCGPWTHHELLQPDGDRYEREDQSRRMIYTFRDPWFFEDPETGETWLLFEANTPVPEGSDVCGGDDALQEFNGSVGIARSPTGDPLAWELEDPLLDAVGVNQELERPHVVYRDGLYYLFISSHLHTFAPGLEGFDALYGFVAEDLRGDYVPLNESGLVATNPENAPFQSYSWMAFPHGDEVLVQSFFNYYDFDGETLDEIAHLSESEQMRRFGGSLGPTLRLEVEGSRTRIIGSLGHWHIPLDGETLPLTDRELIRRGKHNDTSTGGYGARAEAERK
ncbi:MULTISPECIES: glycoside hydrolase family 68 protein [Haloarcula]|uniref:glycoside hydrolase family 68 protein n=1 Tax=Haloarcula TaxID=2237 RepID=UPI000F8DECA5|nr:MULTISPECIES: glycoside hydrolase family 68 protein [Haloarcula]NHN62382.1 glycoside hydrolase family 68 protein [Haloarcula sp. JP-Z28]NHX41428.1 glycoside hydrolase family 68 protein [Haloarcula sp. R1-2]